MIDLVAVGAKIASLRSEKKMSQDALAGQLFVSRQAISAWEMGKSAPSIDNVIALSKLFGVPFEAILCLEEMPSFDSQDPFAGHERTYVIRQILAGKLVVDLPEFLYRCTGEERLLLLRGYQEGRLKADPERLLSKLTPEERKNFLEKGDSR